MIRSIFRVLCAISLAVLPFCAAQADNHAKIPARAVENYFTERLGGSTGLFNKSLPLPLYEVKETQEVLWRIWVKANEEFKEEKLIHLNEISELRAGKWRLPAELEANATMNYYYGTKGGEQPAEGYPLFMYLHGSGDPKGEWANGLKFAKSFEDGPAVYFVPQIPNTGQLYRWWQKSKQWAWEKLLRQTFVSGQVNPDRIYFFGISEGGYGSQRLASFYADYLAGAGPMAGGEPLKNAPAENCRNIAFSLRTGALDNGFFRNVLTGYTKEAFDSLAALHPGDFCRFIEIIPAKGHYIDYNPTTPWLRQHVRNPYPKHVMWENYEMDGRTRTGFYNIFLEEDPGEKGKRCIRYDMDIEDNTISLTVREVRYTTTENQQGIDMKFAREYAPVSSGKVRLYLNSELVNLHNEIKVVLNGRTVYKGKVRPNLKDMASSLAEFYDPRRIYPASVLVDLAE